MKKTITVVTGTLRAVHNGNSVIDVHAYTLINDTHLHFNIVFGLPLKGGLRTNPCFKLLGEEAEKILLTQDPLHSVMLNLL